MKVSACCFSDRPLNDLCVSPVLMSLVPAIYAAAPLSLLKIASLSPLDSALIEKTRISQFCIFKTNVVYIGGHTVA
jgi:hypothetical protein